MLPKIVYPLVFIFIILSKNYFLANRSVFAFSEKFSEKYLSELRDKIQYNIYPLR